jgi:hypothetical protein
MERDRHFAEVPPRSDGLFEALDRTWISGNRRTTMAKAKKSKKSKKAKKAKKAVAAKKKSAKKSSKKAAKKSAKKAARRAQRNPPRRPPRSQRAAPKKAAKKSPAKKRRRLPSPPLPGRARDGGASAGARAGAELGYPGTVRTLMGVRLVQRRRPQLDGRPSGTNAFEKAAASTAAAFFVRGPNPDFHGPS